MSEVAVLETINDMGSHNNALEQMQRAEIDVQVSTARRFPRSVDKFIKNATTIACIDEETAAQCCYSRPVGDGKNAEGMSIRMAEIVSSTYQHLRVGAMIISQTERQVVARGMCHDLENNIASSSEVIESTVNKKGEPFAERMRVVVAKAALAKARRDAIFQVVPRALCKSIYEAAKKTAVGNLATLESRRGKVVAWAKSIGVSEASLCEAVGVKGISDIGLTELETLTGIRTAIRDAEISVADAFPMSIPKGEATKAKVEKDEIPMGESKPVVKQEAPKEQEAPAPAETPKEATQAFEESASKKLLSMMKDSKLSGAYLSKWAKKKNLSPTNDKDAATIITMWNDVLNDHKLNNPV